MEQSPSYRLRTAAITVVIGIIATVTLGLTVLNPSPTELSAPHALVTLPEFSSAIQDMGGPFYQVPAGMPGNLAPGTVIKSEPIKEAPTGITAKRLMYVSQTADGKNNVVTGMFVTRTSPAPGPNGRPLVGVAHGTTGNAPGCGISEAPFTRGTTGFGTWDQITSGLVGAGFAVVATDYANLGVPATPDYITMEGEAHDVLNSMRAAYRLAPDQLDTSKAAVLGHSQGGHAALSTAYVAPDYAPDLAIRGTAALAPGLFPPAPLLVKFVEQDPDQDASSFLAFISYVVDSWSDNNPGELQLSDVFTPKGVAAAKVGRTKCLPETAEAFKGPKSEFVHTGVDESSILKLAQQNFPLYHQYATPLLIQQGLEDTTVVPGVNLAAARTFCLQGSDVELQTYPGDVHSSLLYTGAPQAVDWLRDRFENKPTTPSCGGL